LSQVIDEKRQKFTGRTFSIEVFPFSLKEYMEYFELTDAYEAYTQYRKMGGMAGAYLYTDENRRASYVNDVFETMQVLTEKSYARKYFIDYRADREDPLAMLYQSGYLTVKDYDKRKVHKIGVNISSETRTVDGWLVVD